MRKLRRPTRLVMLAAGLVVALVAGLASAFPATASPGMDYRVAEDVPTQVRQSLVGFDPANIIDDAVFFNSGSMTASAIQQFLNARVPSCQAGYTCLKSFGMATTSRAADAMCPTAYTGRAWESAAEIIFNVARACGVNPQVILATLQKEQGLVTHTWPSDWRYTIAMGQGCPDTAACDTRYYGFFNQVYGAAWQFKRYGNPPGTSQYFTWYAPGRTWNVRFHPNESCGTSPVRIANQATANLYYYTPYQPNAAAMAAGFGEGDSCSSYGNRNFYNYFTDWFGSTHAKHITLAKSPSSDTVWVVSDGSRWALSDGGEWAELNRVYGPTWTVADSFLSSFVDRGLGSNVVRDVSNGSMAVIDGGRSWGLTTCTDVALWGGDCANPVNLAPGIFGSVPAGGVVGAFLRAPSGPQWGRIESGAVRLFHDDTSIRRLNLGSIPAAPKMSARAFGVLPKTAAYFAPGELVKAASNPTVYMTDGYTNLVALPTFATAQEMGLSSSSVRTASSAALAAYPKREGLLAPLAACGATTYFPASGTLHPLASPQATGLATLSLDPATCSTMTLSPKTLSTVLVKSPGDATVYLIASGTRRPLTSWNAAVQLGGANPAILAVSTNWLAALPVGAAVVADGSLVKGDSASVYLLSGGSLHGVRSFEHTKELGFGAGFLQLPNTALSAYQVAPAPLSLWVACGGVAHFGAGGALHRVTTSDGSFATTSLSSRACEVAGAGVGVERVFVKGSGETVYLASGGTYNPVGSWARLMQEAGGKEPVILTVSDGTLRTLPIGQTLM